MIGGRKEDMKGIWFAIQDWMVDSGDEGIWGDGKGLKGRDGVWEGGREGIEGDWMQSWT